MLEKSWLRFCSLFAFTLRLKICNPFYKLPVLLVVNQSAKKTASSTCCQSGKTTASSTCCHSMWEEDCQFYLLSEWEDDCKFYLLSFSVGRRLPVLLVVIQCGKKTASSTCCQWEEREPVLLVVNQSLQSQHQLSGDAQHLLGVVVFSHFCQQRTHATSCQATSVSLHTKQPMHTHTHKLSLPMFFFKPGLLTWRMFVRQTYFGQFDELWFIS